MARTAPKTVRFSRVVERAGQPRVHTLWLPPEKDPELKRARQSHRVMLVEHGAGGGKTDFGVVGFKGARATNGQLLIFPKSLEEFEGARVIGIKFDLVAQPKVAPAAAHEAKNHRTSRKNASRAARATAHQEPPSSRTASRAKSAPPPAQAAPQVEEPPPPSRRNGRGAPPPSARVEAEARRPDAALLREVRAAMKELEKGKAVAAYRRLERAAAKADAA